MFDREGLGFIDAEGIAYSLGRDISDQEESGVQKLHQVIKSVNQANNEDDEDCITFEAFILHMKSKE